MTPVWAGAVYTDGNRVYRVTRVADGVVEYLDGYPDGEALRRTSSLIQWEIDVDAGELRPVKGGA